MTSIKLVQKSVLKKIENILGPILSPRQSLVAVEISLASLSTEDQNFTLHWTRVISISNIELGYIFAISIGEARKKLSIKAVNVWLNKSLAIYDREGLYPAIQALLEIEKFKLDHSREIYTCKLDDVRPKLEVFIRGLSGRRLEILPGNEVYTDTEKLYLPASISKYRDKGKNRLLYKAIACFLWAQTWYGTFKRPSYTSQSIQNRLDSYTDKKKANQYFISLENIRLMANIERDLPGLFREMSALSPLILPQEKTWKTVAKRLQAVTADVEDTLAVLDSLMQLGLNLPETDYQGELNFEQAELVIEKRKVDALASIQKMLENTKISNSELEQAIEKLNDMQAQEQNGGNNIERNGEDDTQNQSPDDLVDSGLLEKLQALLQDVDQLDIRLLENFPSDSYVEDSGEPSNQGVGEIKTNALLEQKIELDEWDYLRQNYRKRWCQVSVRKVEQLEDDFSQCTRNKYPFLMRQIRKIFEAMRDQPRLANRQTDGEDIDLDAVVDMVTAKQAGEELSERMYIRRQHNERSVSVCLLVDMSGSTKGWINLAMRESLVLFSEALNTLGDQYSILGFSGLTRQRCEIYTVKEFEDNKPVETANRIANVQAMDYTRMGFAIRYATRYLLKSDAKHRILLLLSDGKPDDYDGYQGEYGIQDTRNSILEAQSKSIRPFSITIDHNAQLYLPRLFGPGQYLILDDVSTLPLKLSDVYRRLSG